MDKVAYYKECIYKQAGMLRNIGIGSAIGGAYALNKSIGENKDNDSYSAEGNNLVNNTMQTGLGLAGGAVAGGVGTGLYNKGKKFVTGLGKKISKLASSEIDDLYKRASMTKPFKEDIKKENNNEDNKVDSENKIIDSTIDNSTRNRQDEEPHLNEDTRYLDETQL